METLRRAVRAVILDEADRILLVQFRWPGMPYPGGLWACPGGGIEPGESTEDALRRELLEEVGLDEPPVAALLWRKTSRWDLGLAETRYDGQVDDYFLIRVPHFEPRPAMTPEELRAENVHGMRWWTRGEISSGTDVFGPRALADLLGGVIANGAPAIPIEIEGF
ncbi:NUDIX hydrolase [Metallococcus carri]|uniref:NUDIX hydrolase n=1 Tax=Metallococcus carri TaxID=1656884 RepID=UPI002E2CE107|nr:NUDIX domain-containing protein [Metallococcus carri]